MDDKRLREKLYELPDSELSFTKEDRNDVFAQIRKLEEKDNTQKKSLISSKRIAPLTVSFLVVGLCLFLFLPSMFSGNLNKESIIVNNPAAEEAEFVTTLITVKSKEMEDRTYLNLLLTYHKEKKVMKVVSPSHSTYAPIAKNEDGTTVYDKLLFAYNFGGAENVRKTVSKLFDLPIDYYAVMDLEIFSTLIDSVDGIEYELAEDMQVRAITQVAFDFEKGTHRLNGEEVVALMMATSELDKLGEEHLVYLMNAVIDKVENEISPAELKEILTQIEANVPLDPLLDSLIEMNSIKSISLKDGMITDSTLLSSTTGKFFYKFEKEFLSSISQELTTFN